MSEKKQKLPTYTTPKGTAAWASVCTPSTKFKPEGEYQVKLLLPAEDAETKKLIALIQGAHKEAQAAGLAEFKANNPKSKLTKVKEANLPYKDAIDRDKNPIEGMLSFTFKAKASGKRKDNSLWTFKPAIFDAKGAVIPNTTAIFGGSQLRVAFQMKPYFTEAVGAGVSLKLQAVKVLQLADSNRNAASYGFGEEEDGYDGVAEGGQAQAADGSAPAAGEEDF